jgi:DHA1 family bicyclomycin/chloramphenicol resistance-like MFS transporter
MSAALTVTVLAVLLGLQPVTTDLYLPALPALTDAFSAPMPYAQLTLGALMLAFGLSQLIWGPLSDRYGRRPILLWGLSTYTLASTGSIFSTTIVQLIVWRILQGAAMGAVVMCARAIVRDLYKPTDGARIMSRGLTGLGFLACICAPLGGLLCDLFGWRAALVPLAVFGGLSMLLIALRFQETLEHKNPLALEPATLLRTWQQILANPTFLSFSVLSVASYGGLFTFLAGSSFIFTGIFGLRKAQYGLLMLGSALCYVAGTMLCRVMLRQFGLTKTVMHAAFLSLAGGTAMGMLALAGVHSIWAIMLPYGLFMLGHGVHQPCGQAGAVGPFPKAAGTASAMNGFLMMCGVFVIGGWLGEHMDGTVNPMTNAIWFWSVVLAISAWTAVRRYGDPLVASPAVA